MKRRFSTLNLAFAAITILFGFAAHAGTVGVGPYLVGDERITDAVKMRYKLRVNAITADQLKLIFMTRRLYNPTCSGAGCQTYLLESNLYTYWVDYEDQGCLPWPPNNAGPTQMGEAALWLSIPDYNLQGLVGSRPQDAATQAMFPRVMTGIDNISSLTKIETMSQMNIAGLDISVEYARGGTFSSPLGGWGARFDPNEAPPPGQQPQCIADLPGGVLYRVWTATVVMGGQTYVFEFAVPDQYGTHFDPNEIFSIVTEFLDKTPEEVSAGTGDFQAYFWDIEVQRENSSDWIPLRRMKVFYRADPTANIGWGARIGSYDGHPVLEISNDTTDTYYQLDDVFEIPADATMYLRGTFNGWGTQAMVWNDGHWETSATFAAGGAFKFDVHGDWTENYGDNAPVDGVGDRNGADIVLGQAGEYTVTFDYLTKAFTATRQTLPCGTETMYLRGSFNGWGTAAMACDAAGQFQLTESVGASTEFKFDVHGDWTENYGDNAPGDGVGDRNGANVLLLEAGEYVFTFDYATKVFTVTPVAPPCGAATMYLRGTFNGWGTTPMFCNAAGQFETMQPMSAGAQFKFDLLGDWSENYGDNNPQDGWVDRNGANIAVGAAGLYVIRFDYANMTYTVMN